MPFYLEDIQNYDALKRFGSVLIVPCRFCPAASMAVKHKEPYFQVLRRFLKTESYERLIKTMKADLEKMGIRTGVYKSRWLHQFVICMWTSRRRKHLLKVAGNYEAVVVLGCEAAAQTVYDSVRSASCEVFQGMKTEGVMSILPQFSSCCTVSLQLNSITPVVHHPAEASPWTDL